MLMVTVLLVSSLFAGVVFCVPVQQQTLLGSPPTAGGPSGLIQPKISYSRETVAKPGDDVTIDCGVEGIDLSGVADFNVAWSKINLAKPTDSYPISSGDTVVLFSSKYRIKHPKDTYQYSLEILKLEESDTGTYRCTVNFGDNQKINAEVPVLIETAPYFVDPSTKTLTVSKGDAISIDCQPGGSPTPTVFWERVNHELPFYGGNFFKDNQLDIPFVEPSHEGRYICHADNGLGDPAKSEVILSVQYPPELKVSSGQVAALVSESVSVECRVDAYPAAEVGWYKDDLLILGDINTRVSQQLVDREVRSTYDDQAPVKPRVVLSTLTVNRVTVDALGEYECRANSLLGATNTTVSITLKSPPLIESQSARRVFYNDEAALGRDSIPVELECRASGVPAPEYRWNHNSAPLIWQSDPRMSLEPNTGTLLIDSPTVDDNGWYQCVAYNELGVAKSDPVYLLNSTRVSFDASAKSEIEMIAEEGRPFSMACPNATAEPKPELTWAIAQPPKAGESQSQTKMTFFSSNRTVVGPDGTAYFSHVKEADDSDTSGITYLCLGVTKASPQDFSLGTTVKIKVVKPKDGVHNGQEEGLNIETFLMYGSPEVTLVKGAQENRLWCIFGGEPAPHIVWERTDGVPLTLADYSLDNHNSTLVIRNTNLSHSAGYRCAGSNGVGPVATHTTYLEVDLPPVFRESMKSSTVEEGSTVTFRCDAEGSGVLTYSWYFNGRPLFPKGGSRRSVEGSSLTIQRVSITDIGNYACNATSLSGYAYGQATLNVLPQDGGQLSSCPEVFALRGELSSVKDSLHRLRDFVQNTRTAQADASINLIQRIAAKLNILTTEEEELLATQYDSKQPQEDIAVKADIVKKANNRDEQPNYLYAEKVNQHRNEPVGQKEEEEATGAVEKEEVDEAGPVIKEDEAGTEEEKEGGESPAIIKEEGEVAPEEEDEAGPIVKEEGEAVPEDESESAPVVKEESETAPEEESESAPVIKEGESVPEEESESEPVRKEESETAPEEESESGPVIKEEGEAAPEEESESGPLRKKDEAAPEEESESAPVIKEESETAPEEESESGPVIKEEGEVIPEEESESDPVIKEEGEVIPEEESESDPIIKEDGEAVPEEESESSPVIKDGETVPEEEGGETDAVIKEEATAEAAKDEASETAKEEASEAAKPEDGEVVTKEEAGEAAKEEDSESAVTKEDGDEAAEKEASEAAAAEKKSRRRGVSIVSAHSSVKKH